MNPEKYAGIFINLLEAEQAEQLGPCSAEEEEEEGEDTRVQKGFKVLGAQLKPIEIEGEQFVEASWGTKMGSKIRQTLSFM